MSNIRIENVTFSGGFTFDVPPPPPPPTANFTASPTSGLTPLNVSFTDTSTGNPTSWLWDFKNDGTATSTQQNPSYTYTQAGTYSVKLTATNASGSNTVTKTNLVTATSPISNLFVAVSSTSIQGITSTNGTSWASTPTMPNLIYQSVAYGNGTFVAVASGGVGSNRVATSTDGNNWVAVSDSNTNGVSFNRIAFGNNVFVAGRSTSPVAIKYSNDNGNTWANATVPDWSLNIFDITYANNRFVALTSLSVVLVSNDGINWSNASFDTSGYHIAYGAGKFVASGANKIEYSSNGNDPWTLATLNGSTTITGQWRVVAFGANTFVALAGNRVITSNDGITWAAQSNLSISPIWRDITYGNGLFVAVSSTASANTVITSPNGINWTIRSNPLGSVNMSGVTFRSAE